MLFFFFNDTATTEIYTLSLHDALPIFLTGCESESNSGDGIAINGLPQSGQQDRKSTRLNSSHTVISYAVFCLKKKKKKKNINKENTKKVTHISNTQTRVKANQTKSDTQ